MKRLVLAFSLLLATAVPAKAGVSIVDDAGKTIRLDAPARRIVPLYAAVGEILVEIGLGPAIVAKTNSDEMSGNVPRIGTHMRPNIELVAAQRPDLVIQLEGREESALVAGALGKLGIPVARFRIASFDDLFSCITRIAVLTGREKEAENLVRRQRSRLDALKASMKASTNGPGGEARDPAIFFEVRYPNLLGAGKGNMVNDIIRAAGGRNVLHGYPEKLVRLNEETLLALQPDIYLFQIGAMNKNPLPPGKRSHFATLKAVQSGHVRQVDESLFSRPGPQSITAAEQLAEIIREWRETSLPNRGATRP